MGSLFRVQVVEVSLSELFNTHKDIPVLAADMHGESIYTCEKPKPVFILIGSEGKGIRQELKSHITKSIRIPGHGRAESLNAAIAASIIISHWSASEN
jgi:TrmH family RNA methyltransferase